MMPNAKNRPGDFIPSLTGIRCVAAMMVLLLHAWQAVSSSENPILARGYLGVDLFFLLSGYVMSHVYAQRLDFLHGREISRFLWHRIARLYPAHVTVLMIFALAFGGATFLAIPLGDPTAWSGQQFFWQLLLVHGWGVTDHIGWNAVSWSVSVEWFAYLIFPLIAVAITRLTATTAAAIAVGALATLFAAELQFQWEIRTSWSGLPALTRVSGEFICGVALWRCLIEAKLPSHTADTLGFGCLIAYLVGAAYGISDFVLISILALLITAAVTSRGPFSRLLSAPLLVWGGKISYSIYLIHFLIARIGHKVLNYFAPEPSLATKLLALGLIMAFSIGAAAVLYYWVENPARQRLLAGRDSL